jgi:dephospho-CoA kinase
VPVVVGLTGPNASGKGEAARILRALGFAYHSLSDIVREEARALGRTEGRDDLILTGNELRARGGPGVLAERLLPRLGTRDLVDSIRNPAEVDVLRRVPGFRLLGITAPMPVRYERARKRTGRGDALGSLEAFAAKEREGESDDPARQRLGATFRMADAVVDNGGSLDDLERALRAWVAPL